MFLIVRTIQIKLWIFSNGIALRMQAEIKTSEKHASCLLTSLALKHYIAPRTDQYRIPDQFWLLTIHNDNRKTDQHRLFLKPQKLNNPGKEVTGMIVQIFRRLLSTSDVSSAFHRSRVIQFYNFSLTGYFSAKR